MDVRNPSPFKGGERKGTIMFHPQVDKTKSLDPQYDPSHFHPPPSPPPPPLYLPHNRSNQYAATSLVQRPPATVEGNGTCSRLIFILAFTIIIALSVVFMINFILMDSHLLVFHVRHLEMSGLEIDSSTNIQWNTYVSARNPNMHLKFLIENAYINLLYKNKPLANYAYHDQFQLRSYESKDIQADFKVANMSPEDDRLRDMMYEIANNMVLQFDLAMSIQTTFRYEIIDKNVRRYDMEVVCKDLKLQFPPNYTTMGGGGGGVIRSDDGTSKICSLKLT
ncbi:hypothetical protein L6452_24379 [Arctium lappa]|uniref:Uncharacterized protein n=1 Tax=Arctium lappa TaxID=4217 RepID=A0ACB9A9N6_ARCLA|nr:hypothetical protein L6452_24379 [Arctium lappa]